MLPSLLAAAHLRPPAPAASYEVLRASHYTLLTKEEWALALHENFNL